MEGFSLLSLSLSHQHMCVCVCVCWCVGVLGCDVLIGSIMHSSAEESPLSSCYVFLWNYHFFKYTPPPTHTHTHNTLNSCALLLLLLVWLPTHTHTHTHTHMYVCLFVIGLTRAMRMPSARWTLRQTHGSTLPFGSTLLSIRCLISKSTVVNNRVSVVLSAFATTNTHLLQ